MPAVNLTVEIHGHRPSWVYTYTDVDCVNSIYRLYVNKDLLTERTWAWDNNYYIRENVWIQADNNSSYILTIEPIIVNPAQIKFKLNNLQVVDRPFTVEQINEHAISFTLQ
jgi:hypothetical protein